MGKDNEHINMIYTLRSFTLKYGDISGEQWLLRNDGKIYRTLWIDNSSFEHFVVFVEHALDIIPLSVIYEMQDALQVTVKWDTDGKVSAIVYIERDAETGEVPLIDIKHTNNKFTQTKEQFNEVQSLIKNSLCYYAYTAIAHFSSNFESVIESPYFDDYVEYLGLDRKALDSIIHPFPLEPYKKTYRKAIGTIYNTWEMKYFFYFLYLHIEIGILTWDEINRIGISFGYSKTNIRDFIEQVKLLIQSDSTSIAIKELKIFKRGISKPYNRVPPHSLMSAIYSVDSSYVEENENDKNGEATDWSYYDTTDYWNIDDEGLRDALDDDPDAYGNID